MRLTFLLLCFFSAWPFSGLAFAEEAVFHKIKVERVKDVPKLFVAKGLRTRVLFHSHKKDTADDAVERFPKSPVIISEYVGGRSCTITDDYTWERTQVYLSHGENYLFIGAQHNSKYYVLAYDVNSCALIKRDDITGEPWRVDSRMFYFYKNCSEEANTGCVSIGESDLNENGNKKIIKEAAYRIDAEPVKGLPTLFTANGKRMDILFYNYIKGADDAIDIFPEWPLITHDNQSKKICAIEEGGIWIREEIYFSQDERYLLIGEYSGSWCGIASYDMRSCQLVKRLDISESCRWRIENNQALLGEKCSNDEFSSCSLLKPLDLNQFIKAE